MYGRMIGFRAKELTHQGSARLHVFRILYRYEDVKLTSDVTGVKYRLALVFDEEHHRTGTVICLMLSAE